MSAAGEIARPVAVARTLTAHGLSLRKAHSVLDRIARGQPAAAEVAADGLGRLIAALAELGVSAAEMAVPEITAREVRDRLNLSQAEFALQFGLEVRTVQNWEQNRYGLDAASRVLLAVIERCPEAVERALLVGLPAPPAAEHLP